MKVGFNARLLWDAAIRGWNRYTINLLAELSKLGVELFLYTDRPIHESHLSRLEPRTFHLRQSKPMRYLQWEQRWLPAQCAKDQIDVLHSPFNFGLPMWGRCRRVLTLHDAIETAFDGRKKRLDRAALQMRWHYWVARTRAHRIITVSEHAKRDLMKFYAIDPQKIRVTPEAADERFHAPIDGETRRAVRAKYHLTTPYVFYVGGWERRKNIPFLLRAFAEANLPGVDLVLAGGANDQRCELQRLSTELRINGHLKLLGWIPDEDLPALYAEALCFVYPSMYEGFGLQLCEAMASGCPTLAARATCLPEVLGDGGETFSLETTDELCQLLRRISADKSYRNELRARGKRARQFSWRKTAIETLKVYEELHNW